MKKAQTKKRIIAFLCILLLICYPFGFLLLQSHECAGENCAICSFIAFLKDAFTPASLTVFSLFALAVIVKTVLTFRKFILIKNGTLIRQKVKLTN